MSEVLDLNDIAAGKISVDGFRQKLEAFDLTKYDGKHVQIKGCAPTWAHLMVATRLQGKAQALDFLIDDGKGGITVEIFKS